MTSTKIEEIMPCPFCGSKNVEMSGYEDKEYQCFSNFWVKCDGCGAMGSGKNTKEEARLSWNETSRRANAPDIPAEKLQLALETVIQHLSDCSDSLLSFAEAVCDEGASLKALCDKVRKL